MAFCNDSVKAVNAAEAKGLTVPAFVHSGLRSRGVIIFYYFIIIIIIVIIDVIVIIMVVIVVVKVTVTVIVIIIIIIVHIMTGCLPFDD